MGQRPSTLVSDPSWPFRDSEDTVVITLARILSGESPLRLVCHDDDDGCWQFLDGEHILEEDAAVISLAEMVQFDPTLRELADLPEGAYAWRPDPDQPWQRAHGEPPSGV